MIVIRPYIWSNCRAEYAQPMRMGALRNLLVRLRALVQQAPDAALRPPRRHAPAHQDRLPLQRQSPNARRSAPEHRDRSAPAHSVQGRRRAGGSRRFPDSIRRCCSLRASPATSLRAHRSSDRFHSSSRHARQLSNRRGQRLKPLRAQTGRRSQTPGTSDPHAWARLAWLRLPGFRARNTKSPATRDALSLVRVATANRWSRQVLKAAVLRNPQDRRSTQRPAESWLPHFRQTSAADHLKVQ